MSFISLTKRFTQKSNLLRLIFLLSIISEFHFHGIKSLRFLRFLNFFFKNQYSFFGNWRSLFSIKNTLFLHLVLGSGNYIKKSLFSFSSYIFFLGLANIVKEYVNNQTNFPSYNSLEKIFTSVVFQIPRESFELFFDNNFMGNKINNKEKYFFLGYQCLVYV